MRLHLASLVFVLFALGSFSQSSAQPAAVSSLERISTEADTNRTEILRALSDAPEAQREAMGFLIVDMYPAVRNPVPTELGWPITDGVIRDFFWLRCDAPAKELEINATCKSSRLIVRSSANVTNAAVFLDQRLVDFAEPPAIEVNGTALKPRKVRTSLRVLCETLIRRGDPELAFTARLDLHLNRICHTELKVGTPRCGVPAPCRRGTRASPSDKFVAPSRGVFRR